MVCCGILASKKLLEINHCDVTKLSVLQNRNLEKVQLVPFPLVNGRKSHATHQKRELLIPFCNYLVSLKQLDCFFQNNKIVSLSIFPGIRENSFIFIYFVHHTPISTQIRSAILIIFCLLLIWEIWQIVIPIQLCIFFSYLRCLSNTVLCAPKINCLV